LWLKHIFILLFNKSWDHIIRYIINEYKLIWIYGNKGVNNVEIIKWGDDQDRKCTHCGEIGVKIRRIYIIFLRV